MNEHGLFRTTTACSLALCALLQVASGRSAFAAEDGTSAYLKGYKDFLSGVLPPDPGVYMRDDVVYYSGNIGFTSIGGRIRADVSQWFLTDVAAPTVVTSLSILGGTYAFGATVPIIGAGVHAGIDTARFGLSRSDSALNIGDIYLTPVILGWHAGDFHWSTALSIIAPTGGYNSSALANTGLNYWSVLPQFSITYFEPNSGWDVSAAFTYVINTSNPTTDYLTGNIFHLDWGVGKQLSPAWKIGAVGYLMQQVTGDSGSGATFGADKASVWAVGPAVSYSFELNGMPMSVLAKWTHEIEATRTFKGDTATASISFKF
ncbi:MAG: transporter [Acetobacteraceae bacterium]|nr:transporter [Acetobacteraceae bacterium]